MAISQKTIAWQPRKRHETNVAKFIEYVNKKRGIVLKTYHELHDWSVQESTLEHFWLDAYNFLKISPSDEDYQGLVLDSPVTERTRMFPPPRFFPDTKINIAEHMFRNKAQDSVAIHFVREGVAGVEAVTWGDMARRVTVMRDAMISHGVQAGDIVAAVISNSVDAMVICLSTLSIGAIWSSASCELGIEAIVDRFSQIEPKLVFADDGYRYAGKLISLESRIQEWARMLSQDGERLTTIIVIPYCQLNVNLEQIEHGQSLKHFLSSATGRPIEFAHLPFYHPAFILYSSGTTGRPKCIVHSAGGVLLKVKTDSVLQHDIRESDVVFQFTTTAWVMWVLNFVNLCCGKSMLLYDGSPFHPHPGILLELAAKLGVTFFGTSPRYLAEIRARGIVPKNAYDMNRLRTVTSTGAVLSEELFHWFYDSGFPRSTQLISMSGGTDIAGSFVGGTPILPVYAGEIQVKALGMAVEVYDAALMQGTPVKRAGLPGELVCTKPFPSQPIQFHGNDGPERYRKSYFERFGDTIWCQGDFIQCESDTAGLVILGRSDGVLNPSGVRFGSAEIYAVMETFPEIDDSICVGQRRSHDLDERVLLFIKMKSNCALDQQLIQRIKATIQQKYSPRHVPRFVFQVADIPYTVNGKKCEINVKQIVSGLNVAVSGTVANPESLDMYQNYVHLPVEAKTPKLASSKL